MLYFLSTFVFCAMRAVLLYTVSLHPKNGFNLNPQDLLLNCDLKKENKRFDALSANDLYLVMSVLHVNDVLNAITVVFVKRRQDVL